MRSILIGASGFVGTNLRRQMHFDALASSQNIGNFKGASFDFGIVAAGDARKWFANQNPEDDSEHISRLIHDISAIDIKRLICFSTVDVYASKKGSESELAGRESDDAYGRNRRRMELALCDRFHSVSIIRLPGLYGTGLKKNIIYDISQQRTLQGFNPFSTFQWFCLDELSRVIYFVEDRQINELNVCAEPLSVTELLQSLGLPLGSVSGSAPLVQYDIQTAYADVYDDGSPPYLYSRRDSIDGIKRFLAGC